MLVLCNGMPRSGSTLQYNVVRCLAEAAGRGEGHGFNSIHAGHEAAPGEAALHAWSQDGDLHVVKMHEVVPRLADLLTDGSVRVCYIYRDLRDVAAFAKRALGHRGDDLLRVIADAVSHFQQLSDLRVAHPDAVVWQRHEDVYGDLRGAIREAAGFLGVPGDTETVEGVYDRCSLDAAAAITDSLHDRLTDYVARVRERDPKVAAEFLRELRRSGGTETRIWRDPDWLLHYNHISRDKGAPGAWVKSLSPDEADAIHTAFGGWLSDAGYHMADSA